MQDGTHEDDSESESHSTCKITFSVCNLHKLDWSQYSRADMIEIHPSNDLHTCKMEHEDDSEREIFQFVK